MMGVFGEKLKEERGVFIAGAGRRKGRISLDIMMVLAAVDATS